MFVIGQLRIHVNSNITYGVTSLPRGDNLKSSKRDSVCFVLKTISLVLPGLIRSELLKPRLRIEIKSCCRSVTDVSLGAIHSTKIQTGSTGKRGPPQKVDQFFRNFSVWIEPIHWVLDRNFRKFWLNGSRPLSLISKNKYIFVSSTQESTSHFFNGWGRSLTYTLKSRGPKMDPCGTQVMIGRKSDTLLLIRTVCYLDER